MCLYPKTIKNPKYLANKKNGGVPPIIKDKRLAMIQIPCNKCMECVKNRKNQWNTRLQEDIRHNKNVISCTLQFTDERLAKLKKEIDKKYKNKLTGYNLDNAMSKLAFKRFKERYRYNTKKSLRHFAVTEIGGNYTERIHIHGIFWNTTKEDIEKAWNGVQKKKHINHRTYNGYIYWNRYTSAETVGYYVKYIHKRDPKHKQYKPKLYISKGIGKDYLNRYDSKRHKYNGEETILEYRNRKGIKMALPRYLRNKIFTEEEREKLMIMLMEKGEKWIDGQKINLNNITEEEYTNLLRQARSKAKRLGYNDNTKDEEEWLNEMEQREVKQSEIQDRLKKKMEKNDKMINPKWKNKKA